MAVDSGGEPFESTAESQVLINHYLSQHPLPLQINLTL
jgi:hypothetical protein